MLQIQKSKQKFRKRNIAGSFSQLQVDKPYINSILYLGSKEDWDFNHNYPFY